MKRTIQKLNMTRYERVANVMSGKANRHDKQARLLVLMLKKARSKAINNQDNHNHKTTDSA
ncbi:hypothetical protein [Citrobacter sp. R56]|uniref:hypothetical protein n=1 Tax=Citrobacter sp. R56 TaxID=1573676 RepID=UPI00193C78F0|nr:hypothetical protein [Citrobacter sp. R56]QRG77205.1 hypothetical protein JM656_11185 [Citrobacter sp. R56]